jgi:hypothetical protein
MSKIFIGGSRKLTELPISVRKRLDNIIVNDFIVLIGDANGTDKCVQGYLASKGYKNVVLFCMTGKCRNNIGEWEVRIVEADSSEKTFDFYATKDRQMAEEASYGFMIWDGKSNGTLNNMLNLLGRQKKILVYFSPEKSFYTIRNSEELSKLLSKCDRNALDRFEKKLSLTEFLKREQAKLEFA